jgi:hypothetical protein
MPIPGSDGQEHRYRDGGAPYSEVTVWRRRFYVALAAVLALLALSCSAPAGCEGAT